MTMLNTLRWIIQEVNVATNLRQALRLIVNRVREAMQTEVCSVYLADYQAGHLMLMATEGLNPDCIGQLTLSFSQGLVGLVARREEPINLNEAATHPSFHFIPESGEEPYNAFLGVPIIHRRRLLGVLVVQQKESRRFDESEEAFLVTLSAQLAGLIVNAEAQGLLEESRDSGHNKQQQSSNCLRGIPGAPGVALGRSIVIYPQVRLDLVPDRECDDIEIEIQTFRVALSGAREDIRRLAKRMNDVLPAEEQSLFEAYLHILDGASLGQEVEAEILAGHWAQGALRRVIEHHVQCFESMEDDYLRERAVDLQDLGSRVLSHLMASPSYQPEYPPQTILVGEEVTASMLAEVPRGHLAGIVCLSGSTNSHVAILARAMGVPAVMGIEELPIQQLDDREIIVDGHNGEVYISPSESVRNLYRQLASEEQQLQLKLNALRELPSLTRDGVRVPLHVNTGLDSDLEQSLKSGAEGVGLYRTEIPFMTRDRFPSEEEQRQIYRQMLEAFAGRPVTMRTLDIGGDKELPYFPLKEENPFLGWRGIRITLDHPEFFLVQTRAMLRACHGLNNLRILLPMISNLDEVDESLRLLRQAHAEVLEELHCTAAELPMPPVGVMIEVPAAVYQAEELARKVNFLSIGSNDLTQYLLAVDRNNARVAHLYDALHPAVLRAIYQVAQAGRKEHCPVSICGEMAGDPMAVPLLVAMGVNSLSMNPISIAKAKWVIRSFSSSQLQQLLDSVLKLHSSRDVRQQLRVTLNAAGLNVLVRV